MSLKNILHIPALLLVVVRLFAADGANFTIIESSPQRLVVEASFDSISFVRYSENGDWFTTIKLPNAGSIGEPGQPDLPMAGLLFGIPAASQPSLKILSENVRAENIGQVKRLPGDGNATTVFSPVTSTWYPNVAVELGVDGFIRDLRVLSVRLYPVRYQANTQMAQVVSSVRFEINFGATTSSFAGGGVSEFEPVYKSLLDNYESSRAWRAPTTAAGLSKTAVDNRPVVKIELQKDGVYKVTALDLARAGVDVNKIDPRTLALSNKGVPIPILVEGKSDGSFDLDDRIIFLGQHNAGDNSYLSYFSDTNVYQLTWGGAGLAFTELAAAPNGDEAEAITAAPHSIHFEFDKSYERLVGYENGDDDHWFWEKLMNDERINFPVTLPGLTATSTAKLTAAFHGLSLSEEVDLNHHIVANVDDQRVGEAYGSQNKPFTLYTGRFTIGGADDNCTVWFDLPLDNANVFADFTYLNWFEIEYDRALHASDNQLVFTCEPGDSRVWQLSGFSSERVYLFTDNGYRLVSPKIKSKNDGFALEIKFPSTFPARLYAVEESALLPVASIELAEPARLKNTGNSADYIIITHKDFKQSAERLAAYRQSTGLRTMVVDIQQVYDEFSHGLYDPRAIKRFIAYAAQNWGKPAPLYIVLLGDTTYLMDKDAAAEATLKSFVPSFMVNTNSFGMTSSDNYFACINGEDRLPDIYLGRLPANTTGEAETMIDKIISYETKSTAEEWRRHITLAAGNGSFFDYSAQNLVDNYLPKWLVTSRLSTDFESPFFNTTEDFISWFNSGQNIINFLVHGSGEQIADAGLFTKDDILRLSNADRYAFAVTMSCYIGHFDNPEKHSLGEALFTAPDKGLVGMFGSAGKSYIYSDYYFNAAVFNGIFNRNWRTLGEITTNAKYELIDKTKSFWEPVENFLLLGDPATELKIPRESFEINLSKKVLAEGDILRVSGAVPTLANGTLTLTATGSLDSVLVEKYVELQAGRFDVELFTLTPQLRQKWGDAGGLGAVRAFVTNGQNSAVGLAAFSVKQPLIKKFVTDPEKPASFEPVRFRVEIDPAIAAQVGGLQTLTVKWTVDKQTWNDLPLAKTDETRWISSESLKHEEGTTIRYKMVLQTGNGNRTETETREYLVLYNPDVYVDNDVRYFGENGGFLRVTLKNRGQADADSVALRISLKTTGQVLFEGFVAPKVIGRDDTTTVAPIPVLPAGSHTLAFLIDPQNTIREEEEGNNGLERVIHIATPQNGSNGAFLLANNVSVAVPASGVARNTSVDVVALEKAELKQTAQRAGLTRLKTTAGREPQFFHLQLADTTMLLTGATNVTLPLDVSDSTTALFARDNIRIYAWENSAWKGLESARAGDRFSATLPAGVATFALMASTDAEPPVITIAVQGQHFADNDVVPANPMFTIAIEDGGAVDVSTAGLRVWLDEEQLLAADYAVKVDASQAGLVHLTVNPELTRGQHKLKISAADMNANARTVEAVFSIAEKFGVEFVANHPNPFARETTLAFLITDMASAVDLKIYTVSGRLIRSFEFIDITGYNEVDWDGADSDGYPIANGVYYLKFSARKGGEKIERIERLAKLE